jgi:hypothetical protein
MKTTADRAALTNHFAHISSTLLLNFIVIPS